MVMETEMEAEVEVEVAAAVTMGMMETVKEAAENGTDWEVEQIKGTDGEEMMLTMVELGMEVTVEGI
jgi:hypothetical protein